MYSHFPKKTQNNAHNHLMCHNTIDPLNLDLQYHKKQSAMFGYLFDVIPNHNIAIIPQRCPILHTIHV